jgi:hypothetical protein
MKQYEIWVTDKANIPTYIKTYPYKLQCWIWAMMHGYINRGRNMYFKDERVDFREVEE